MSEDRTFLFSVDLEEFSAVGGNRSFRRTPLPELAERYLAFLRRHRARATFFVVGETARAFPGTIRDIAAEGHELACHTDAHRTLDRYTPATFRDDLRRNLDALHAAVPGRIQGFRAPVLSLTERTRWAYEVLAGLGFTYSSSVLPASNPLHGWPGFGDAPVEIDGLVELPVTLARVGLLRVPIGSGTYFRCLPMGMIRRRFAALLARGTPVVGYFHPYDCDPEQERVMNEGVNGSRFFNSLLYFNRAKTMGRLDELARAGFRIEPYHEHLARAFPHRVAADRAV
ncbi:MAG TPA: polysaccharide deacetylase family protein [Chthoniobacteraceae bacterium]|nr:polysaccharide deacetylase family protein [Chthoniobacteraceae bacterium]